MIVYCVALMFTIARCADDQHFLTKTVDVGQDVTLKCSRPSSDAGTLFWIKLAAGNLPEVLGATYTFDNGNVNKTPRITTRQEPGTFVLHITKTELSDSAFYYCEEHFELRTTFVNITFLRVQGPEADVTAVIQELSSDPVHPGDSVTLQCSVLFDSKNRTCCGDHSVSWFRTKSDKSHPILIFAHGNSGDECEKTPEAHSPQKCVYSFSRSNVSSSDAGTYYCAVATCGQILFGDGTKLDVDDAARVQTNAATTTADQHNHHVNEESLVYSVPDFAQRIPGQSFRRAANGAERSSIYADVRVLGYE
ncbi:signal-regulatory protein beta-2-like [Anabas testudineus]|uniref:signal-regulatory protein beta-2-like n=1 Tax=Anabas testudineus TaxID=64144 RepID=UPI000E4604B3|nr:signal-regulatory protein beta-2-like [Anabas testudineus]